MLIEPLLEQRVTNLEQLLADLITSINRIQNRTDQQLNRTDQQIKLTDQQIKRTDEQIKRTDEQIERTQQQVDKTSRELSDFKRDSEIARIDMRRQWGELSNRLGTMVENSVAPSIGRILAQTIGCSPDEIEYSAVRVRKRSTVDHLQQEFDTLAVAAGYLLINQTKSKLRPEDIPEFIELLQKSRLYFPEYADHKIIGVIASLYVDPSLVRHGERQGLIVLGFGNDVMQVLNSPEFVLKTF